MSPESRVPGGLWAAGALHANDAEPQLAAKDALGDARLPARWGPMEERRAAVEHHGHVYVGSARPRPLRRLQISTGELRIGGIWESEYIGIAVRHS